MLYGATVYILTNVHYDVLYIGVTSDLFTRITEPITKVYPNSFTAKYKLQQACLLRDIRQNRRCNCKRETIKEMEQSLEGWIDKENKSWVEGFIWEFVKHTIMKVHHHCERHFRESGKPILWKRSLTRGFPVVAGNDEQREIRAGNDEPGEV